MRIPLRLDWRKRWRDGRSGAARKLVAAPVALACIATTAVAQLPAPLEDATIVTTEQLAISPVEYGFILDNGWSVRGLTESKEVYVSGTVESVGEVEDVIVSGDGRVLSLILETGGVADIGDTHVSMPWTLVERGADERIVVPNLAEGAASNRGPKDRTLSASQAENELRPLEEGYLVRDAWRATEFLDAPARLPEGGEGVVSDLIIGADGQIAAVIVKPGVP